MIAAFGMYDRAETAAAHDRLWTLAHAQFQTLGIDAPKDLTRGDLAYRAGWVSPDLLVSQTCGLPLRSYLRGQVTLVGTPDYGLPGCEAGYYRSVLLVRRADPRSGLREFSGARFAVNDGHSQSGWAAACQTFDAADIWPGSCVMSGAHRKSALLVAQGAADLCAVDAVTWRAMTRWDDYAADLRVVAETDPTPGLPLITALSRDPAPIFSAMQAAIRELSEADAQILGLRSLVQVPLNSYLDQPIPPTLDQIFAKSAQSFAT